MSHAIQIENLSKVYHLGTAQRGGYATLREGVVQTSARLGRRLRGLFSPSSPIRGTGCSRERRWNADPFWALKDVSFDIDAGEVVGIIGRNGAGKSTLLKILSRIIEPSSGRCKLHGRVGSLLEVGTGFHPELTGRENIFLNGAILGMSRHEIAHKFDEIVEFAEVERFLDTPVKRYSSGMYVRLAFAVAAHMRSEILLIDEVLAVGDAAFQSKCLGKMSEVSKSGRTVLFVSHNMGTVLSLCEKAVVLEHGKVAYTGPVAQGVELYMNAAGADSVGDIDLTEHPNRRPGFRSLFRKLRMFNAAGKMTDQFLCGEAISIELTAEVKEGVRELHFGIGVEDALGCRLFTVGTYITDSVPNLSGTRHRVLCRLAELPLAPGRYYLSLNAGPLHENAHTDTIDQAVRFEVTAANYYGGGKLPHSNRGRFLVRSLWEGVPFDTQESMNDCSQPCFSVVGQ